MHIPFDFGNSIEMAALFTTNTSRVDRRVYLGSLDGGGNFGIPRGQQSWEEVKRVRGEGGEAWGHANPDLQVTSSVSGCPLYLTPQKHWPADVAERYFGNRTVFGTLRDPYERLVAQFRGDIPGYGGQSPLIGSCGMNEAVKQKLRAYQRGDRFMEGCTYLPQAEFYDMPYGITLPVDNFLFPASMNEVFRDNGYTGMHIGADESYHVWKCEDSWSADLDNETRALVRQIYARDFDLLCKHFNYCDPDGDACIAGVPQMCPGTLFEWDPVKEVHCPRPHADVAHNVRVHPKCRM